MKCLLEIQLYFLIATGAVGARIYHRQLVLDHSKFMFTNGSYTLAWNTLYDNNDCVVNYQVSATNCDMDMSNISVTINQHITLHREDLGTSQQPVFINITQTLRDSDHQCNDSFAYNYNYELIQIQPDTAITEYIQVREKDTAMIVIPLHDNNQFIPTIVLPSSLSGKQTQPDIICPVVFFYPYERCYDFHPCYGFDESVYTESNITICYEEDDRLMKVYFNNVTKEMNSTKMFVINSKTINCGFEYVFVRNYKYSFQLIVDSEESEIPATVTHDKSCSWNKSVYILHIVLCSIIINFVE